jgi:adenine-specific DNA-methyltransferase
MHKYPKINYIGNKEKICNWIVDSLPKENGIVLDLFSGGSSVSYALKNKGYIVYSNDVLYANYVISKALIENKNETLLEQVFDIKISEEEIENTYNDISFLVNNLYYDYEVKELSKLMCISKKIDGYQKFLFLSLLRRAMIRKLPYSRMNVPWEQIKKLRDEEYSYQKYGRKRAYHNFSFEKHMKDNIKNFNNAIFDNNKDNKSFCEDALDVLKKVDKIDIIYMDPPYPSTMNNYDSFYGLFDRMFGFSFNSHLDLTNKKTFIENITKILDIAKTKTEFIVFSINNKSKTINEDLYIFLCLYSSAEKIGISHNYQVTGTNNKGSNREFLYILKIS